MTCSSPINSCNLALSSGPWRPPLLELINTTSGHSAATGDGVTGPSAVAMASRIARRKYSGIVIFCRNSSFGILIPDKESLFMESIIDELTAALFTVVSGPGDGESILIALFLGEVGETGICNLLCEKLEINPQNDRHRETVVGFSRVRICACGWKMGPAK
ncbi:hypothetical protein LXL04_028310 [Taraxacum kok-saghyz]